MPEAKAPNSSGDVSGTPKAELASGQLAAESRPSLPRVRPSTLSLSGWMRSVMDELSDDELPRS
jgi:hypothetical protein